MGAATMNCAACGIAVNTHKDGRAQWEIPARAEQYTLLAVGSPLCDVCSAIWASFHDAPGLIYAQTQHIAAVREAHAQ